MADPSLDLSPAEIAEFLRQCAEQDLYEFVQQAWPHVEPGTPFRDNWHIEAISEHLQAVSEGQIRRLIINIPPRCMKSLQTAVMWPCWDWGPAGRPHRKFLFASYAQTLSIRDSLKCRRLILTNWYQRNWGRRFKLTGDQNAKVRYDNTALGYRLATSVGGALTGEGGDIIVIDDPHNAVEGESEQVRESTIEWWDGAMSTRLNDPKTGAYVIVMQRLHERDLVGHILAKEHGWEHLCLPARYETEHPHLSYTSLGFVDPRDPAQGGGGDGSLLWPERLGETEIKELEERLGTYNTAGQLQQRPAPAGGGVFQREWFRYFSDKGDYYVLHKPSGDERVLKRLCRRVAASDLALTEKTTSDWSVRIVADVTPTGDIILVDLWRARVEAPDVDTQLRTTFVRWNPLFLGIEEKHYGQAFVQEYVREGLAVLGLKVPGDKVVRSITASVQMQNGKMYFPASAPWLDAFEQELEVFPHGAYDDQADTLSYIAICAGNRYLWRPVVEEFVALPEADAGHLGGPEPLPADWPVWVYLSAGHYTAAVLMAVDPEGRLYAVDECYSFANTVEQNARDVQAMLDRHGRKVDDVRAFRLDPKAAEFSGRTNNVITLAEQYQAHGLPFTGWPKANTEGEHARLQALRTAFAEGRVRVSPWCRHLSQELQTWRHKPDSTGAADPRDRYEGRCFAVRCLMAWAADGPSFTASGITIIDTAED